MSTEQEMPKYILVMQGSLMLGVALAPTLTSFRFFFPRDLLDWIGTITSIIGTTIVFLSVLALKKDLTIQAGVKPGTELATRFPFSHSRNPIYVGGIMMCVAWSLLQRSQVAAVLTILLLIVLHFKIRIEERNLERFFGEKYIQYKKNVRRYF